MSAESTAPHGDGSDVFTYQGKKLSRAKYLGAEERGPLGEQFLACERCGASIHKFSIRCCQCGAAFREIGKIESGPRGSAGKGIGFVVGILVFALAAMVLGERAVSEGTKSLGGAIGFAAAAFLLGVNGLLGTLYFRYFALVTFLRGLAGLAAGALSVVVAIVLLILLL